jgi:antitoxin VapB
LNEAAMTNQCHVKITRNIVSDTISLPADLALSTDDVIIRKKGDRLIIEPVVARNREVNAALRAWLATQDPLPPEDTPDPISREDQIRPVTL